MQSTEEYLDQLLASVSEEDTAKTQETMEETPKSIEDLDETELTEEALQEQLAMLLGLEIEKDEQEETDDFMMQYAAQVAEETQEDVEMFTEPEKAEKIEDTSFEMPKEEAMPVETETAPQISNTGVLSADEIAALFASMGSDDSAEEPVTENLAEEAPVSEIDAPEEVPMASVEVKEPVATVSDTGVLSPDEIAALFASMGGDDSAEETPIVSESEHIPVTENIVTESEEVVIEPDEIHETVEMPAFTEESANKMMSPDEIAALFASMGAEESQDEKVAAEPEADMSDEFAGLKDADGEIQEIPDFNLDEEALLDLENVDALLEATAKQAEDENSSEDMLAMEEKMEEDIFSMLAQFEEESVQETMAKAAQEDDFGDVMGFEEEDGLPQELLTETSEDEPKGKKKKKEKVKKEKVKKEKVKKEKPEKKNKVSLKDKFMAFAFEDSDEDSEEPETEEKTEKATEKKPAKDKKKDKAGKKDKKSDKGKPQDENAAIEAELAEEDKKKKHKKEKPVKEKKVKPPKKEKTPEELEAERREERHSIKTGGIVATLLVCASILGLILVGTYFVPMHLSLVSARVAFYAGDYEEVTMRMEGRRLNESDKLMYEKSNLLYGLQERYHQYEIYEKRQMPKEALNALLQGVIACKEEAILAEQFGIVTEWKVIKEQFESALLQQYGLSVQDVETISELRNPAYTIAVENIMAGKSYDDMSSYGGTAEEEPIEEPEQTSEETAPELEDLLPEEEAILEQMQQNNSAVGENGEQVEVPDAESEKELYSGTVNGGTVNFVQ